MESSAVAPSSTLMSLISNATQKGSENIKDFLKKPIRLSSGSFATTDTTQLATFNLPSEMLASATSPIVADKIKGILNFKADIVLTLVVNATKFNQGRYILGFVPSGGAPTSTQYFNAFYRAHSYSLVEITQLPHVEIDLAKQTSVQLVIPFSSHHVLYSAQPDSIVSQAGRAFLRPYSALVAGSGPTSVGYTLWASFENITFSGATVVQSSFKAKSKSPSTQEQKDAQVGPVSAVLTKIGTASSIIGEIPYLTPFMQEVSWFSAIMARAANVFGFSKPVVLNPPKRVVRTVAPYMPNADGSFNGQQMGLLSTNEVVVNTGTAPTSLDEMSIDFIKSIYSYIGATTWSTSNVSGDLLRTISHSPVEFYVNNSGFFSATPLRYLMNSFSQWRGGIKVRIKLVKTEFHSGRLAVCYVPWNGNTQTTPTMSLTLSNYVRREIVDIRETSQVEFCLPYVSQNLYNYAGVSSGYFYVYVLDALVAPSTVSSSVTLLFEVCGDTDLEFACPANEEWEPFIPPVVQSGYTVNKCVSFGDEAKPIHEPSAIAVGEKITSLRQLCKRLGTSYTMDGSVLPQDSITDLVLTLYPYTVAPIMQFGTTAGAYYKPTYKADEITKISLMYAYSSGGMRYHLRVSGSTTSPLQTVAISSSRTYLVLPPDVYETNATFPRSCCQTMISNTTVDANLDVQVPAYNVTKARPVCMNIVSAFNATWTSDVNAALLAGFSPVRVYVRPTIDADTDPYLFYRSAADDFNLSYFVSTVPFISPSV